MTNATVKELIENKIARLEESNQRLLKLIKENETEAQAIKLDAALIEENRIKIKELKWVLTAMCLYE